MSLTRNKMQAARDLIIQQRFAEARAILLTVDHPIAKKWLNKLDQRAPAPAPEKPTPHNRYDFIITLLVIAVILALGLVVIYLVVDRGADDRPAITIPGELPYQVRLDHINGAQFAGDFTGEGCDGYVPTTPQHIINWPGDATALQISVSSNFTLDTVMVIQGPTGRWYCDDDSNGNLDAPLNIINPVAGEYAVYVGVYNDDMQGSGTLYVNDAPR